MKKNAMGLLLTLATAGTLFAETREPRDGEFAVWQRQLLPLPHELRISKIQRIKPWEVGIRHRVGAAGLERQSFVDVVKLFSEKTGVTPEGKGFEILIGLMDAKGKLDGIEVPRGARLNEVPNKDQAYMIQPVGDKLLMVAALSDRGLYYAARTLSQWLEFHLNREVAEIPLAEVVDWPDLEERGFWHMPASLVPWLASMKINRFMVNYWFTVDNAGIHPCSNYNEQDVKLRRDWARPYEKARQCAVEGVPSLRHMDFWEQRCEGFSRAFPDVIGKGEAAKDPFNFANDDVKTGIKGQRVPCASNPKLVKILTAVMMGLAAEKASELMVWMSEYPAARCECANCAEAGGQYVNEARAAVAAWRETKKTYPDFKLSVFFGRGGFIPPPEIRYPDHEIIEILASLPPEVTMRASMGCDGSDNKLLANFAAKGKRITRMNVVTASSSFMSDGIRKRVEQIVADKYVGGWSFVAGGYASDKKHQEACNYQLCALAEYFWNAKGRNAKEFAEAWACRQRLKDPAKFFAWLAAVDIPQASRVDKCWTNRGDSWFKNLAAMAAKKQWDETWFNQKEIEIGVKQSERALALAEELGNQDLIDRSRLLLAYSRLEYFGYEFIAASRNNASKDDASEKMVENAFARLKDAGDKYIQTRIAISAGAMTNAVTDMTKKAGVELAGVLDEVKAVTRAGNNREDRKRGE